jgi:GNAT superfamily N-acetyltransferase
MIPDNLRSLAVPPEARGRGLGTTLLVEAFRVFHERAGMAARESYDIWERPSTAPRGGTRAPRD